MHAPLALLGAAPRFPEPLHVGRPNLGDRRRLFEHIEAALDRRWLTNNGYLMQQFEDELAERLDVPHCIAVCNATAGMEILLRALDLSGEVIVPSFTFIATVHALRWVGVTPVFCDIDPRTHNLDPAEVERLVTPRTSAILGVHLWGRPCDIERLQAIADRHELQLIFDSAHAFGCSFGDHMLGGFGRAEVFSFHATKWINAFEGGAITTADATLADRLRKMCNFGFTGKDVVAGLGTNAKMHEASAAMGLTSLASSDDFLAANLRNYRAYQKYLAGIPGVSLVEYDDSQRCNYHYVVAEVDAGVAGLSRDELMYTLHAENVIARRYFWPGCHRMQPYAERYPDASRRLPRTEAVADRVLVLPTGTSVDPEDIEAVAGILRSGLASAREVRAALANSATEPAAELCTEAADEV